MQTEISKDTIGLVSSLPIGGGETEYSFVSPLNISSLISFAYEFQCQELFSKSFVEHTYSQCLLSEHGKHTAHEILTYWIIIGSRGDFSLVKERLNYAFKLVRKYNQFGNPSTLEFLFNIISRLPEQDRIKEVVRILYDENHLELIDGYTCKGDPYFQKSLKTIAEVVQHSGRTELTDIWIFALVNHCGLLVQFLLDKRKIEEAIKFVFCYIDALKLSSNSLFDKIYAGPFNFMAAFKNENYTAQSSAIYKEIDTCFPGLMKAISQDKKYILNPENSSNRSNRKKIQNHRRKRNFIPFILLLLVSLFLASIIASGDFMIAPFLDVRQDEEVDDDVQSCSDLRRVRNQLGFNSWDDVDARFQQEFPDFEESIDPGNPDHAPYRQAWCSIAREWLEEQS